jgi:hypothetical protein
MCLLALAIAQYREEKGHWPPVVVANDICDEITGRPLLRNGYKQAIERGKELWTVLYCEPNTPQP